MSRDDERQVRGDLPDDQHQAGWMGDRAQFEYIKRVHPLRRPLWTQQGSGEGETPKLALPLPAPVSAPVAPVSTDPASQLAALIAQMAGASINPETVARIVDERITAALANIPTIKVECQSPRAVTVSEGRHHPVFVKVLKAASARQTDGFAPNIWLAGPTASGKTHLAKSVSKALALDFHAHGAMLMGFELLGFVDAGGTYHATPFRRAFEHGGVVLLDELDAWDPSATLALNAALANGLASFPDGKMVPRHPDCIVIGAGNTWGAGATAEFVGRAKLDAAFLSRFPVRFALDYDPELEQHIAGNAAWAMHVQSARAKARAAGLKVIIDPRVSVAGAALVAAGFSIREAAEQTYLANLSADQRRQIGE
jgi:cobaltochelatase CobS